MRFLDAHIQTMVTPVFEKKAMSFMLFIMNRWTLQYLLKNQMW